MTRALARVSALAVALTLPLAGCANSQVGGQSIARVDPRLNVGEMGTRTNFELRTLVADQDPLPAAGGESGPADAPRRKRASGKKSATKPIFIAGIILSAVGGIGTLAFGTGGLIVERQLTSRLYDSLGPIEDRETFTEEEYNDLKGIGDVMNALAITSVVVGLVGMSMAVTAYGYDYTHCGVLAPKRRGCEDAGYALTPARAGQATLDPRERSAPAKLQVNLRATGSSEGPALPPRPMTQ